MMITTTPFWKRIANMALRAPDEGGGGGDAFDKEVDAGEEKEEGQEDADQKNKGDLDYEARLKAVEKENKQLREQNESISSKVEKQEEKESLLASEHRIQSTKGYEEYSHQLYSRYMQQHSTMLAEKHKDNPALAKAEMEKFEETYNDGPASWMLFFDHVIRPDLEKANADDGVNGHRKVFGSAQDRESFLARAKSGDVSPEERGMTLRKRYGFKK